MIEGLIDEQSEESENMCAEISDDLTVEPYRR